MTQRVNSLGYIYTRSDFESRKLLVQDSFYRLDADEWMQNKNDPVWSGLRDFESQI